MDDRTYKIKKNVSDERLIGLKRHSEEINRVVIESLQGSLLVLIGKMPYEDITITRLCAKAGVSRMAFYGNFSTKDDILRSIIVDLQKELVDRIGNPFIMPVTREWYIGLFELVYEKSEILKPIFGSGFQAKYVELINSLLLKYGDMTTEEVYLRLFWCGGIVNAIAHWLANGLKESPSQMADICQIFSSKPVK